VESHLALATGQDASAQSSFGPQVFSCKTNTDAQTHFIPPGLAQVTFSFPQN
jgi:hypothetical protein